MSSQAGDSSTGTKIINRRLPDWLRKDLSPGKKATATTELLSDLKLNTICESGKCPNKNECYSQNTATIMILGEQCTRNCHYCAVKPGKPTAVDPNEPERVLEAVRRLGLEHVVITSVTRDDLPDEGIGQFIQTIQLLRNFFPGLIIEVLTPDFRQNQTAAIDILSKLPIDIFNHNIETVRILHKSMRPQGGYDLSLNLLKGMNDSASKAVIKSGAMLGVGETEKDIFEMMKDLRAAGCTMLTLGQYLQPTKAHRNVDRFVSPEEFNFYKEAAFNMGFELVDAGPFVRSSYHAKDSFEKLRRILSLNHRR